MTKKNNQKGFTMMEVLAAIFVITTGIMGVFSLVQRTISFTAISSSRLVAIYLAQEGIEIVKNIRDGNWLDQRTSTSTLWSDSLTCLVPSCEWEGDYNSILSLTQWSGEGRYLNIDGLGLYSYSSGTSTKFKRKITTDTEGQDSVLKVIVEVTWEERGRGHKASTQGRIYNWH